ncbi:MAG: hypothetical protein ABW184_11070 [Sphingobium sp.]
MSTALVFLIGFTAVGDAIAPMGPVVPVIPAAHADAADERRRRPADSETLHGMPLGTITIERRIIIRVPMLPPLPVAPRTNVPQAAVPVAERRSSCLSLRAIRGATIHERVGLLFVTQSNDRYQASLERGCRPVDFQSGFYLNPSADGAVCAGRDLLHARSGAKCAIVTMTRLSGGM